LILHVFSDLSHKIPGLKQLSFEEQDFLYFCNFFVCKFGKITLNVYQRQIKWTMT
jgi:hypothetical protein